MRNVIRKKGIITIRLSKLATNAKMEKAMMKVFVNAANATRQRLNFLINKPFDVSSAPKGTF